MNPKAVHCLLDVMAFALEAGSRIEHRPLYCGAWDDPFTVTSEGALSYYSPELTNDTYLAAFSRLYGRTPGSWYQYSWSKKQNYMTLLELLEQKSEYESLLVQLDLYYMPYPTRCYETLHRPHFVMVDRQYGDAVYIRDPYFGWEGDVPLTALQNAFYGNELGGGVTVRLAELEHPTAARIASEFEARFDLEGFRLADAFEDIVHGALAGGVDRSVRALGSSVDQLGIIARRKYSYSKVSSFFAEALGETPDPLEERVNGLVKGWMNAGYASIRASIRQSREDVVQLADKAAALREEERKLKRELRSLYERWKEARYESERTGTDRVLGRTGEARQ